MLVLKLVPKSVVVTWDAHASVTTPADVTWCDHPAAASPASATDAAANHHMQQRTSVGALSLRL